MKRSIVIGALLVIGVTSGCVDVSNREQTGVPADPTGGPVTGGAACAVDPGATPGMGGLTARLWATSDPAGSMAAELSVQAEGRTTDERVSQSVDVARGAVACVW